jgi:hypothetical protein
MGVARLAAHFIGNTPEILRDCSAVGVDGKRWVRLIR